MAGKCVVMCDRRHGRVYIHGGSEMEAYRLLTCRPDMTVDQLSEAVLAGDISYEVYDLTRPVLQEVEIAFSRL